MEITARELRDLEIAEAWRGYNRDVVNDLLERAAATIETTNERVREMSDRLGQVQVEAGRGRETEDILHRTLLLAQRAADEAVAEAQQKARQMVEEAELQSRKTLAEAENESRRRGEAERIRLEQEVLELAERRDALLSDVEALTRFEAEYRDRMVHALDADLAALRTRPSASPGPRPEAHDVELPVLSEPISARAPPTMVPPKAESGPVTREVDVSKMFDTAPPAPPAAPVTPPVAAEAAAPELPHRADPKPENSKPENPKPVPQRGEPGSIDLLGDDALEAEVLDDDAFFATLREAVHDDTPLGPRDETDEGRLNFFDDEGDDRASFRDVFRRRR
jgi:cell division septum initiation protein DivIVA